MRGGGCLRTLVATTHEGPPQFIRTWRALPEDQRDAYRKRIVQMNPEDRAAELSKPPTNP